MTPSDLPPEKHSSSSLLRLAPYLAMRTSLSRRQAERAILEGRVTIDGEKVTAFVVPRLGVIRLDNDLIPDIPMVQVWRYHKPPGVLVTRHDPQGRVTIFHQLRHHIPDGPLVTVGRLDYASEGLILVTNRPRVAHILETSHWKRTYLVTVRGSYTPHDLALVRRGPTIQGITYRPCDVSVVSRTDKKSQLKITLTEGKNREIRILLASINLQVIQLKRLTFGPFVLGSLALGHIESVPSKDLTAWLGEGRTQ